MAVPVPGLDKTVNILRNHWDTFGRLENVS